MPESGQHKQSFFARLLKKFQRKNAQAKRAAGDLAMHQVVKARGDRKIPTWSQFRELPRLLSKTEKRIALSALLLFVFAGAALGIRLINSTRISVPAIGGEYTEGLIGTPQLINPLYASTSDVDTDLATLIFSGLMRFDSKEGLITDLAESFSISEDQLEYTFVLKENARFHDGNPVRIDDIIFTVSAIQNPEYRSPLEISFSGIGVEQVDERTVKFILDEPFTPFLSLLTVGILPSHIWQDVTPINAPNAEFNRKPIGSGPYRVDKISRDGLGNIRSYSLIRHDRYHGDDVYIKNLTLKFYPEITTAVEALRNQNVEGLAYLPASEVEHFNRVNAVEVSTPALQQYTAVFLNDDANSILSSLEVRQALNHAVDKDALVNEAFNGLARSVHSFILPGMIGEYEEPLTHEFNLEKARSILEEDGWNLAEGETVRKDGDKTLTLTLTTLDASELVAVAELLKAAWAEIGVDVAIQVISNTEFQNEIIPNKNYEMLLSGELYGIDPDPYVFWHSSQIAGQGLNLAKYANRDADGLIEDGRTTTDIEERAEAYRELQDIILEDIPAIFLYQPLYPYPHAKKIQGTNLERIVSPSDRFGSIEHWFIKTRKVIEKSE